MGIVRAVGFWRCRLCGWRGFVVVVVVVVVVMFVGLLLVWLIGVGLLDFDSLVLDGVWVVVCVLGE